MIKYIKGNIFKSDEKIIAHGCNAVGAFGSGVAGQVAKLHPEVKDFYKMAIEINIIGLGDVQVVPVKPYEDTKIVVNCITQSNYLPRNVCHADYSAIRSCMKKLKTLSIETDTTVSMPRIGAGLAGGDWNTIEAIINEEFGDLEVRVYDFRK